MVDVRSYYGSESDYLKATDLALGKQYPLTITGVEVVEFDEDGKKVRKLALSFKNTDKRLVLNRTNAFTIETIFGGESDMWIGRQILVYRGTTQYNGKDVPALKVQMPMETADFGGSLDAPQQAAPARQPEPLAQNQNLQRPPPDKSFEDDIPF